MKVLLDIKDNKADFILELLNGFSGYVKTKILTPAKALFLEELREAVYEVTSVKAGREKARKARKAEDFLHEL